MSVAVDPAASPAGRNASDARAEARLAALARVFGGASLLLIAGTLWAAFLGTPPERTLGEGIRILYVHVGAAWVAYLSYAVTALGALLYLWRRRPIWDRLALASAEWGLVLTTVTLVTGSLWGRQAQGWWWQWSDRRLTLTLLMWFLYAAYLILRRYTEGERRARVSALIALLGLPAMVLNHFATVLFRGYHPDPIVARPDAPAADAPYLIGLGLSLGAFTAIYGYLLLRRMLLASRRAERDRLRAAQRLSERVA